MPRGDFLKEASPVSIYRENGMTTQRYASYLVKSQCLKELGVH